MKRPRSKHLSSRKKRATEPRDPRFFSRHLHSMDMFPWLSFSFCLIPGSSLFQLFLFANLPECKVLSCSSGLCQSRGRHIQGAEEPQEVGGSNFGAIITQGLIRFEEHYRQGLLLRAAWMQPNSKNPHGIPTVFAAALHPFAFRANWTKCGLSRKCRFNDFDGWGEAANLERESECSSSIRMYTVWHGVQATDSITFNDIQLQDAGWCKVAHCLILFVQIDIFVYYKR